MYTYLDGLDAFDPHSESVVRSTTNLVAAQKEYVDNEIHADFHYFLSGTGFHGNEEDAWMKHVPGSVFHVHSSLLRKCVVFFGSLRVRYANLPVLSLHVEAGHCCKAVGSIVAEDHQNCCRSCSYPSIFKAEKLSDTFCQQNNRTTSLIHLPRTPTSLPILYCASIPLVNNTLCVAIVSTEMRAEPSSEVAEDCPEPCSGDIITYFWSTSPGAIYMLDKVSSDADPAPCWMPVFEEVADGPPASAITAWDADCIDALLQNVEEQQGNNAAAMDSSGSDAGSRSGEVAVTAAVTIPIILIVVVGAAFLLLRHQRRQRIKKMRTTDEAWGEGLDGMGKKKGPRPPTGKFKLGIAATPARPTGEAGRDEEEGVTPRTCSPPARTFTDISVDGDNDDDGEEEEVVVAGFGGFRREADEENTGADNMVYPL